ncbi:hypothetical protein V8J88_20415 [Massilia sp. W12]|uniref:hypothetical protein n=1 Tax=Massilia sp. W12 TaxID=3126507 RepID=UPI0030D2CD4B
MNWLSLLCLALLVACERPMPMYGSTEHNALHGIINDGKTVNQITLFNDRNNFRPTLRFDPEITVYAGTLGWDAYKNPSKIRPGWANEIRISLSFTADHKLVPDKKAAEEKTLGVIDIDFNASLGESHEWSAMQKKYIDEIIAKSPIRNQKDNWGLHEYMVVDGKDVERYVYVPIDQNYNGGRDYPFSIHCDAAAQIEDKVHPLINCVADLVYQPDIAVTYKFVPKLLPYWREIYRELHVFFDHAVQR